MDLNIPDPVFFFPKKMGDKDEKDYIILVILRNFAGKQMKLSNLVLDDELYPEMLDFEWACNETLLYFKLKTPIGLSLEHAGVISKRISQMPNLLKVKFDDLWPS